MACSSRPQSAAWPWPRVLAMTRGPLQNNRLRKLLGVSAVLGVAATGVVVARRERRRRTYTPGEVREHLHRRHAEALLRKRDAEGGVWGSE